MKSDHRHELKTNELAEWLTNLPQWARKNRIFIISILAVIIAAVFFHIWRSHSRNIVARQQLELTNLAGEVLSSKMQILQAQLQGKDLSFILLQPAENLRIFAENTNDDQMAAFALIKRAEALRTELHYRLGAVSEQEAVTQIDQAKTSYAKALERCPANPTLMAAAKFGLGLCEEELGNFDLAEQIYRDIATSPDYEGTVTVAKAKVRLETMADYKQKLVFPPPPKPKPASPAKRGEPATPAQPPTQAKPTDTNLPIDINLPPKAPNAVTEEPDTNVSLLELNSTIELNDINQTGK